MKFSAATTTFAAIVAVGGMVAPAYSADMVRIANAQRGFWDQTLIEFAQEAGIFERHDIELDILWTDGGADAQQAVIGGSMDIAVGTGVLGVISAWARGAPIEIMAASMTGSSDLYWYVPTDSEIESFEDTDGRTVAFSRPGASTNLVAAKLVEAAGTSAELVPTGGPAGTMTQVMSGQIDVGWSAIPVGLDREQAGEIRMIASGNDAPGVAEQTVRVQIVNRNFLEQNPDIVDRFLTAYQEALDWAYDTDEALEMFAAMHDMELDDARHARDLGYPPASLQLFPIQGMDVNLQEALDNDRLDEPMSDEQVADLMRVSEELQEAHGQ